MERWDTTRRVPSVVVRDGGGEDGEGEGEGGEAARRGGRQAPATDWGAVRRRRMDGGPDAAGGSRRATVAGKGIIAMCRGWLYRGAGRGQGGAGGAGGAWERKGFWKGIWIGIWRGVNG